MEAEGEAHGDDIFAQSGLGRVSERYGLDVIAAVYVNYGEVGVGVNAKNGGRVLPAAEHPDGHVLSVPHDVVIRDDPSVGVYDETGA